MTRPSCFTPNGPGGARSGNLPGELVPAGGGILTPASTAPRRLRVFCASLVLAAFAVLGRSAVVNAYTPPGSVQLPNTSAVPPSTPMWLPGLVALALVMVAGCGLALRRMRITA